METVALHKNISNDVLLIILNYLPVLLKMLICKYNRTFYIKKSREFMMLSNRTLYSTYEKCITDFHVLLYMINNEELHKYKNIFSNRNYYKFVPERTASGNGVNFATEPRANEIRAGGTSSPIVPPDFVRGPDFIGEPGRLRKNNLLYPISKIFETRVEVQSLELSDLDKTSRKIEKNYCEILYKNQIGTTTRKIRRKALIVSLPYDLDLLSWNICQDFINNLDTPINVEDVLLFITNRIKNKTVSEILIIGIEEQRIREQRIREQRRREQR